jgi:hypothetical protein
MPTLQHDNGAARLDASDPHFGKFRMRITKRFFD